MHYREEIGAKVEGFLICKPRLPWGSPEHLNFVYFVTTVYNGWHISCVHSISSVVN